MDLEWLGLTLQQILIALLPLLNSHCLMGKVKSKLRCFLAGKDFSFLDNTSFLTDKNINNTVLTAFMGKTRKRNRFVG